MKYAIDENQRDVTKDITITVTQQSPIEGKAIVYVDDTPEEVSSDTDMLEIKGKVENFDIEAGTIVVNVGYSDGTTETYKVPKTAIKNEEGHEYTYTYSIKIPLKEGDNFISVSAVNPIYGGNTVSFVVTREEKEEEESGLPVEILIEDPMGEPVYGTVTVRTLDGTPVGVFEAKTINGTAVVTVEGLDANRYYIFEVEADGYEPAKKVKKVEEGLSIQFTMQPTDKYSEGETVVENQPPVVEDIKYVNFDNFYEFEVDAYDPDGDELKYYWYVDGSLKEEGNSPIFDIELQDGVHTIEVTVEDERGETTNGTSVEVVSGNINPPQTPDLPPAIELSENSVSIPEGSSKTIKVSITDPEGDLVTVDVQSSDPGIAEATYDENNRVLTITGNSEGNTTITLTADDGNGGVTTATVSVEVISVNINPPQTPDLPPAIELSENSVSVTEGESKTVNVSITDPEGDDVTVNVESADPGVATVSYDKNNGVLTITGESEGTTTVTIKATDSEGNEKTATVSVTVSGGNTGGNEGNTFQFPPSPGSGSGLDYPPNPSGY